MFRRNWKPATATIVARQQIDSPDGYLVYDYAADVQPDDGAPAFRAEIKAPFNQLDWNGPQLGAAVRVTFDPKSLHVKFDTSDPSLRLSTGRAEEQEHFEAVLEGAPESAPAPPPAGDPGAALRDVSATAARIAAEAAGAAETIAAIKAARAAGDLAEVDRLKAEFQQRADAARAARDTAAPTGADAAPAPDLPSRLQELADLHDRGALTDDEFAAGKAKLLSDG